MRDFRDAKAMAQSLREAMGAKHVSLTHSEALELVSTMLGFADWNTLSAAINRGRELPARQQPPADTGMIVPAIPMRDLVPFPTMHMIPLWIKREKTVQALANARRRELVVVAQKSQAVEEPGADDVFDVGVIAKVLDVGPPSEKAIARDPRMEGATQIIVQTQGRVAIRKFLSEGGAYEAEIDPIEEGEIPAAPELIEKAAALFERYATAHKIDSARMWPPTLLLHDPGRVADVIAPRLPISIAEKQGILATLDPVARLERVMAHMET